MTEAKDLPQTACPPQLTRVLMAQLKRLKDGPAPFFIAAPRPADMRVVYFLVAGLGDPYAGGEYIFQLIVPDEFPAKPPRLVFLTPTGVFVPGHRVCISVGEFHANDRPGKDGAHGWRPALGLRGFALEVVNALICSADLGGGIGIEHKTPNEKRALALGARAYNRARLAEISELFEAEISSYDGVVPVDAAPADAAPAPQVPEPVANILAARRLREPADSAAPKPAAPKPAAPKPAATGDASAAQVASQVASQVATKVASHVAAPVASPVASQAASQVATPVAANARPQLANVSLPAVSLPDAELDALLAELSI
jgi:ubiquitin-protein ligase